MNTFLRILQKWRQSNLSINNIWEGSIKRINISWYLLKMGIGTRILFFFGGGIILDMIKTNNYHLNPQLQHPFPNNKWDNFNTYSWRKNVKSVFLVKVIITLKLTLKKLKSLPLKLYIKALCLSKPTVNNRLLHQHHTFCCVALDFTKKDFWH